MSWLKIAYRFLLLWTNPRWTWPKTASLKAWQKSEIRRWISVEGALSETAGSFAMFLRQSSRRRSSSIFKVGRLWSKFEISVPRASKRINKNYLQFFDQLHQESTDVVDEIRNSKPTSIYHMVPGSSWVEKIFRYALSLLSTFLSFQVVWQSYTVIAMLGLAIRFLAGKGLSPSLAAARIPTW